MSNSVRDLWTQHTRLLVKALWCFLWHTCFHQLYFSNFDQTRYRPHSKKHKNTDTHVRYTDGFNHIRFTSCHEIHVFPVHLFYISGSLTVSIYNPKYIHISHIVLNYSQHETVEIKETFKDITSNNIVYFCSSTLHINTNKFTFEIFLYIWVLRCWRWGLIQVRGQRGEGQMVRAFRKDRYNEQSLKKPGQLQIQRREMRWLQIHRKNINPWVWPLE